MATGAQPGEAGGVAGAAPERGVTEPRAIPTAAELARARREIRVNMVAGCCPPDECDRLIERFESRVRAEVVAHERERAARCCEMVGGRNVRCPEIGAWDKSVCDECAAAIRAGEGA